MGITSRLVNTVRSFARGARSIDVSDATTTLLLLAGRQLALAAKSQHDIRSLADVEFKVFSQFGDDGIIQWLTGKLDMPKTFIEFGVEDYRESNTRFLMMNDNWSGMVMDGSEDNVSRIICSEYYWKYDLSAKPAFIDRGNINALLSSSGLGRDIGILSVDLDGNDYWILKEISTVSAVILIVEYNSVFGAERPLTVPYDPIFQRTKAHHSNLYWGASLAAIVGLCNAKKFAFVGCNSAGNNAYFVRRDKLNAAVREVTLSEGFVASRFRDSRDREGRLTYHSGDRRLAEIRGMPIFNVETQQMESL